MNHAATVEPPFGRTVVDEGRASPGVAGGSNPVGGPKHVQLGEIHGPCTDCVKISEDIGGLHMADIHPHPQR